MSRCVRIHSKSPPQLAYTVPTVRISVGIEDFEDLKADLVLGFRTVIQVRRASSDLRRVAQAFDLTY